MANAWRGDVASNAAQESKTYWRVVTEQTTSIFDGALVAAAMLQAATLVESKATQAARRAGKTDAKVAREGLEAHRGSGSQDR